MRVAVVAVALLATGCGRRNFDDLSDAGDVDGAVALDAPDATACAFTFCDDFSRSDVAQGWDTAGGTGDVSVAGNQLTVTLDQTSESYFLERALPAPTTSVTVRMKLGYATTAAGINCEVDLARLTWDAGTCATPFGFYLVRDGTDQFNLQETNGNATCAGNRQNYVPEPAPGLHDIVMTVTLGAAGVARIDATIDGATLAGRTTVQPVPSSTLKLAIGGVIVRNNAGTWTITYDDVVVDVQ